MHGCQRFLTGFLVIGSLAGAAAAGTATCIDYETMAHWTGVTPISATPPGGTQREPGRIIVNGDVLYVTGTVFSEWADRLFVIDASDPTAPAVVDSLDIYTADIVMQNGHLYVASVGDGVNIVSLADPQHPVLVGHLNVGFVPYYIRVRGALAYVSYDGTTGVAVDISDPAHPFVVGPFDIPWGVWALSFAGDVGYVGIAGDIAVLDFTDPLRPTVRNLVQVPQAVAEMTVIGNLGAAFGTSTLYLFDLTDPLQPGLVSSMVPRDAWYVQRVDIDGDLLLWTTPFGAEIWDISRLEQPTSLGWIPAIDTALDFGIGPERIYVVDSEDYARAIVAVMDFGSRDLVSLDAMLRPFGEEWIGSYDFAGQRMITCTEATLAVYDLPEPTRPVRRGTLTVGVNAQVLDADGDLAVVRNAWGLRLVDVSAPDLPVLRGMLPATGRVRLSGNRAFIAGNDGSGASVLAVFDLTDPDHPLPLGGTVPTYAATDLIVEGNLAISVGWDRGAIFDIANPTSPRLLSEIGYSHAIGLNGDHLYTGAYASGFRVYDISNPSDPTFIASHATLGFVSGFAFDGDLVYVNHYFSGCQILDVSDLNAPKWVGTFLYSGGANLQVRHGIAYFGTLAAPLQCGGVSTVDSRSLPAASLAARVCPNPFNPVATVTFDLASPQAVRLTVHDVAGRRLAVIAETVFGEGSHEVRWDGRRQDGRTAPSGTYFFKLEAGGNSLVVKAALLK